jgi:hypothetical protein
MSNRTLSILAAIVNANINTALTGTTEETVMNAYANPFPTAWLAANETGVILTVTRNGNVVQYAHCTDGAMFIEAPVPTNDGSRYVPEVRNVRHWDYLVRLLALNAHLQVGDLVEVKSNTYHAVARFEITEVTLAPKWSEYGVRQPVENKLVTVRGNSHRFYGDGGYYCAQVTGTTHPVTGLVEANLSRW